MLFQGSIFYFTQLMKILLAYYSRTGNTEELALRLAKEFAHRGHEVSLEKIETLQTRSKWRLALPLLSTLPVLPLYLWVAPFRRWWLRRYPQAQLPIRALKQPDVSGFDRICIGGPKWLYIAYPVARYLQQVTGLTGKRTGAFATFCGPPLPVFEMEMLLSPMQRLVQEKGAVVTAQLAVSSHFHEFFFFHEMEYVFRLASRLCFQRSLRSFTLDSAWGQAEVNRFCDRLCNADVPDEKNRREKQPEKPERE